jgi:hypothetical protein
MAKPGGCQQRRFDEQQPWLAFGAAAEHDKAAGRSTGDEQHDQPERAGGLPPLRFRKADAKARGIAAHERDEQSAEMQEADAVDIAREHGERAGQRNIATRIEHVDAPPP